MNGPVKSIHGGCLVCVKTSEAKGRNADELAGDRHQYGPPGAGGHSGGALRQVKRYLLDERTRHQAAEWLSAG